FNGRPSLIGDLQASNLSDAPTNSAYGSNIPSTSGKSEDIINLFQTPPGQDPTIVPKNPNAKPAISREKATPASSLTPEGLNKDIFNNDFSGTSALTERTPDGPQANLWDKLRAGANDVSGAAGNFIKD